MQAARNAGVPVVFDAGGMDGPLPPQLLNFVDILSPNETELARLTGMPTESFEEIAQAALKCHELVSSSNDFRGHNEMILHTFLLECHIHCLWIDKVLDCGYSCNCGFIVILNIEENCREKLCCRLNFLFLTTMSMSYKECRLHIAIAVLL